MGCKAIRGDAPLWRRVLSWVVVCASVLLLVQCGGGGAGESTHSAQGTPRLEVLDSILSVGTMQEGETVEASYCIRNAGGGELQVEVEQPDCACVTVRPMRVTVGAGEMVRLRVAFDSRGFSGSEVKRICLRANSSEKVVPLLLLADVSGGLQWKQ